MLKYPEISPVIFQFGPFALRWYGLMYAISFFTLISVMRRNAAVGFLPLSERMVERLFLVLVLFILGFSRVFYVVFYAPAMFLESPLEVIAIWKGGLSFHGGLFGTFLAITYAARKARVPWLAVADSMALCAPIGVFLGRIGNFINGELWGRVTTVPWGMIFPSGGPLARHPSQLYESFLEGFVLGVIMWTARKRVRRHGVLTSIFLVGYPVMRIVAEFFREPDAQLGFIAGPFTMGQLLSAAALAGGLYCLQRTLKHGPPIPEGVWSGKRGKIIS